jgi:hypothetical protein
VWPAVLAVVAFLLVGCTTKPSSDRPATPTASASPTGEATTGTSLAAANDAVTSAAPRSALAAIEALEVKGRAPKTGYSRDQFGPAWADVDHNGCDTRNDILARDLSGETFKPGTHDCVVLTGALADPYSGTTMQFLRGTATSEDVQIDHVVPLSDAWQKGAQTWDVARRTAFANDPLNLLAVQGTLNMQKGDGDAATWLPPNRAYRCDYVARQVAVKVTYGLWVTQAEKDAMATILATCPGETLPSGVAADVPKPAQAPAPTAAPAPAPAPAPEPGVSYKNCTDVKAHGAAPIHAGDPGWDPKFDRDGDGVGCE